MARFSWRSFIQKWREACLQARPAEASSWWPAMASAGEDQICEAEHRLSTKLPKDYKAFLKLSNGWQLFDEPNRPLLPIEHVRTLPVAQPLIVEAYGFLEGSKLNRLLQISEDNEGFYYIDPEGGKAGFFANWQPGFEIRGSFRELIIRKYDSLIVTTPAKKGRIDLRKPPERMCDDPQEFLERLESKGYFALADPQRLRELKEEFLASSGAVHTDIASLYQGAYPEGARGADLQCGGDRHG